MERDAVKDSPTLLDTPVDSDIGPVVASEARLVNTAEEPLKPNELVKDEVGSDFNGAVSVTILMVVVCMDRDRIEDSIILLDISGNPYVVLNSPRYWTVEVSKALFTADEVLIPLLTVDEGRDMTVLISNTVLTTSEVIMLEGSGVPELMALVDVSKTLDVSTPVVEATPSVLRIELTVPVKLAEAELAVSERIPELLGIANDVSVVEDSIPTDPIVVEGSMKILDVAEAGILTAPEDGSKVNDSVTTSIVLESITVSELTPVVRAAKLVVTMIDGSRLKDSDVLTISIELDSETILIVENKGSLVEAGRVVD